MISKKNPFTCQTFVISKKYSTPVKHPRSQKNTPHLTNIRYLKKYPTPVKHPRSQKYTTPNKHPRSQKLPPHLTNIRDPREKKYTTPNKHPRSQKLPPHLTNIRDPREKNIPHLTNIRNLKLFSRENSHVKTGKKYVSQRWPRTPSTYTTGVVDITFRTSSSASSSGSTSLIARISISLSWKQLPSTSSACSAGELSIESYCCAMAARVCSSYG